MNLNPVNFFANVREHLFGGKLTQAQVNGLTALLEATDCWPVSWRAYALATAYHETARTMQPIKEYGSHAYLDKYDTGRLAAALGNTPENDDDGQKYAGRGYVQLTGLSNYKKAKAKLGHDLVNNPDLAMREDIAADILRYGMEEGWFTARSLNTYLKKELGTFAEFREARRIINGVDARDKIAQEAIKFQEALLS